MSRNLATILFTMAFLLVAVAMSPAAVPDKMSVQGRLTTAAGTPVPNGSYTITFSIWDDPTAGTMQASEVQNVQVSDGLFSAVLQADITKLSPISARYLQYQIQGDPPISPRSLLTSSPYSLITSRVTGDIETSAAAIRVASSSSGSVAITGDPDFDLLRLTATQDSAKIRISGQSTGDPDFDLLRISGGTGQGTKGAAISISGDPDFDLLRIQGSSSSGPGGVTGTSGISITGDPDFDLLRMTATQDSAKIRISGQSTGDPDFDLLRIVGGVGQSSQGASISIGGDPDYDLLRMKAGLETAGGLTTASSSMSLTGDPDFDLLRMTADKDSAKIRISGQSIGDPDFDLLRIVGGVGQGTSGASVTITGDPDFDLLRMSADHDSARIRLGGKMTGDPDFDLLRLAGGSGSSHLSMQSEPGGPDAISHSLNASCDQNAAELRLRVVPTSQTTGRATTRVDATSSSFTVATGDVTGDGIELTADNTGKSVQVGSALYLDATRSNDDEVVKTFSWKQTSGPLVTRMEQRADSAGSSARFAGKKGYDAWLRSNDQMASIYLEDSTDITTMEMHGEGRLGVGKPADATKRIDVAGGAFCSGTNWINASDVNSKENFSPIDAQALLDKIADLDITEWNYRNDSEQVRHIGPTAQDFYRLFGIGNDDKSISTIDPAGISLAAIKELYKKSKEVDQLKQQVEELSRQLMMLKEQISKK